MSIHKKEKKNLIKNLFEEVKDNNPDVFSIMCYYLEKNLIKIIIRRIDSNSGWGKDVKIKLYGEINKSEEIISIGSSDENIKKIEVYTQTELFEKKQELMINSINNLSLLYFPNNNEKDEYYTTFEYLQDFYPNLDIIYCDELFQREYISLKKPQYFEMFEKIANEIIQKQFFVLIYIYEEGGIFVKEIENILPSISNNGKPIIDIYKGYCDIKGFIEKCDVINSNHSDLIQQLSFVCINSRKNMSIQHYFDVMVDEINRKPSYYLFNNSFCFDKCKIIVQSKIEIYECDYLNEGYYMLSYLGKRFENSDETDVKIIIYLTNEKNETIKIDSSIQFLKENFQIKENIYVFKLSDLI